MSKRDKVGDDQNKILPGIKSQSSPMVRRSGQPVILIHSHRQPASAAASAGLGDAATSDECFEQFGVAAVRVLARFTLPRMSLPRASIAENPGQPSEASGRKTDRQD